MKFPSFHWPLLSKILSYNPGMLGSYNIHPGLGCPLVPKSIEIPRQMRYLTKYYESSDVPHDIISLPIFNVRRLL